MKFIADTAEDVKNIKVGPAQMGCEVYVIDTQKQYVLDSKGVWHSHTGDDVIICDCIEESTIWEELPTE